MSKDYTMLPPPCIIEHCNRKSRHVISRATTIVYGSTCVFHHEGKGKPVAESQKMARGCENKDGHVTGTKCTTTITHPGQLHWDHIDGNRYNKSEANKQVLCADCHHVKGQINGDHANQGAKRCKSNLDDLFSIDGTVMKKKPAPIEKPKRTNLGNEPRIAA